MTPFKRIKRYVYRPEGLGISHFRSVLIYLILVGIPFAGLVGVLGIGRSLEAPAYLGGNWIVDPATVESLQRSCAPLAFPDGTPEVEISQSGLFVRLWFKDAAQTFMTGRFTARGITLSGEIETRRQVVHNCGEATRAILQIDVIQRTEGPDRLQGTWKAEGCGERTTQSFLASRAAEM